jgi:hypothetical protein
MKRSSRSRLTPHHASHFAGRTLFDRIARAACAAECLPRKELFESWEVARRVRRRLRGGRVVDLACGHSLLAHILLLLDDSSPESIAVDRRIPPGARKVAAAMAGAWPRLEGRVRLVEARVEDVALREGDLVVSAHACGALTDVVLRRAAEARARVAVLPCCQALGKQDRGGLDGWLDGALAIDVVRATWLRGQGYRVRTQTIPDRITPKNRLLLAEPSG